MSRVEPITISGGIKVLPSIPATNPMALQQSMHGANAPVSSYKSSMNIAREKEMKKIILTNSLPMTIDANSSAKISVNFTQCFDYDTPFIEYFIVSPDEDFELESFILERRRDGFVLKVCNGSSSQRSITVVYRAF